MNSTNQLLEIEKTKRLARGQEIYNNGQVSQLEDNLFIIKDKYVVEDLSTDITPIFVCSCPDFTYRVDIEFCKHIYSVILAKMENNKGIGA